MIIKNIKEVERIRTELKDVIFLGETEGDRLAVVVANCDKHAVSYTWKVDERYQQEAILYTPFEKPRKVCAGEIQEIPGIGLHILVTIVFGKDLAR